MGDVLLLSVSQPPLSLASRALGSRLEGTRERCGTTVFLLLFIPVDAASFYLFMFIFLCVCVCVCARMTFVRIIIIPISLSVSFLFFILSSPESDSKAFE